MDLDVCVDERGNPYLGHAMEYHEKTGEPFFDSMPLWEAVTALAESDIPVIVDCKHSDAWPVAIEAIERLRPERCLVHSFVSELRFAAGGAAGEPDFLCEWSPIETLRSLKDRFPSLTTTASAKWLPADALVSEEHRTLLDDIAQLLREYAVDTVCLNVPEVTYSDRTLKHFLSYGILAHVNVDKADVGQLSEVYVGETDRMENTSRSE